MARPLRCMDQAPGSTNNALREGQAVTTQQAVYMDRDAYDDEMTESAAGPFQASPLQGAGRRARIMLAEDDAGDEDAAGGQPRS